MDWFDYGYATRWLPHARLVYTHTLILPTFVALVGYPTILPLVAARLDYVTRLRLRTHCLVVGYPRVIYITPRLPHGLVSCPGCSYTVVLLPAFCAPHDFVTQLRVVGLVAPGYVFRFARTHGWYDYGVYGLRLRCYV